MEFQKMSTINAGGHLENCPGIEEKTEKFLYLLEKDHI